MTQSTKASPEVVPEVVELVRIGRERAPIHLSDQVAKADSLAAERRFLHWSLEFPQIFFGEDPGFDAVIGNPPWEEVTVERLAFYARYSPGIRSLGEVAREAAISDLLEQQPELPIQLEGERARLAQERTYFGDSEYEAMTGDPDLYKFFCQRYKLLLRDGGRLGVVLPRSAFIAQGSEGFRRWLLTETTPLRVDFLVNRRLWMFVTHPQYTVALVVAKHVPPDDDGSVRLAGVADSLEAWLEQSKEPGVNTKVLTLGPSLMTPLVRSDDEAAVLAKVRYGTRFPHGPSGRWRCFPVRELDETNDKHLWRDATAPAAALEGERVSTSTKLPPVVFVIYVEPRPLELIRQVAKEVRGHGPLSDV